MRERPITELLPAVADLKHLNLAGLLVGVSTALAQTHGIYRVDANQGLTRMVNQPHVPTAACIAREIEAALNTCRAAKRVTVGLMIQDISKACAHHVQSAADDGPARTVGRLVRQPGNFMKKPVGAPAPEELASSPRVSRLARAATRERAAPLHGVDLETFIASRDKAPPMPRPLEPRKVLSPAC